MQAKFRSSEERKIIDISQFCLPCSWPNRGTLQIHPTHTIIEKVGLICALMVPYSRMNCGNHSQKNQLFLMSSLEGSATEFVSRSKSGRSVYQKLTSVRRCASTNWQPKCCTHCGHHERIRGVRNDSSCEKRIGHEYGAQTGVDICFIHIQIIPLDCLAMQGLTCVIDGCKFPHVVSSILGQRIHNVELEGIHHRWQ